MTNVMNMHMSYAKRIVQSVVVLDQWTSTHRIMFGLWDTLQSTSASPNFVADHAELKARSKAYCFLCFLVGGEFWASFLHPL